MRRERNAVSLYRTLRTKYGDLLIERDSLRYSPPVLIERDSLRYPPPVLIERD